MGRKPHKLIQEYFARGAKLPDASNRYQYTCKSCGEKFPKGRTEGLITHLLAKCPALTPATRQAVLQELLDKPNQNGAYNQLAIAMRNEQLADDSANHDPAQNMSALETLAEVSRQQLDTPAHEHDPANLVAAMKKRKRRKPNEEQQRLQSTFAIRHEPQLDPQLLALEQATISPPSGIPHTELFSGISHFVPADIAAMAPTARMVPAQLALAASAANGMVPLANHVAQPVAPANLQGRLDLRDAPNGVQNSNPIGAQPEPTQKINPPPPPPQQFPLDRSLMLTPRASTAHPDMPHVHFCNNFLLGVGSNKRVRGRFSENRRKEVQEVRKQGACIRCRMLKKPCSGGTPCTTCQNVEQARLWKIPCLRSRMADEFDLFSAGVQALIAHQEISECKDHDSFQASSRQIVAAYGSKPTTESSVKLKGVRGRSKQDVNSLFYSTASSNEGEAGIEIEVADANHEAIKDKVGEYFENVKATILGQETSAFMRPTLQVATNLARQKMDPLLGRALDLWVATRVLSDPGAEWSVFIVEPKLPQDHDEEKDNNNNDSDNEIEGHASDNNQNKTIGNEAVDAEANSIHDGDWEEVSPSNKPLNYRLLTQQMRGATEKWASQVARNLINDLEKRLLQRQQNSAQHFETFITTIILLNCIERMCWLYNTWAEKFITVEGTENSELGSDAARGMVLRNGDGAEVHPRGAWPPEYHLPHGFVEKGSNIANLLATLLKMRDIPPKTVVGQDGVLRASMARESGSQRSQQQGSGQNADHEISTDELVAHLAQAAAATATVDETLRSYGTGRENSSALEEPTPIRKGASASSDPSPGSAQAEPQSDGNRAHKSVAAAWFDQVGVTEAQLRKAQTPEVFDERDYRCWDLRFIARLMLPDD